MQPGILTTGLVPPQAVEMEAAAIGAAMMEKGAFYKLYAITKSSEVFYLPKHQLIYDAMLELYKTGMPIDLLTVTNALMKSGNLDKAGGHFELIELTRNVVQGAHLEAHAQIVVEKYLSRELGKKAAKIMAGAYRDSEDIFDQIDAAGMEIFSLSRHVASAVRHARHSVEGALFQMEEEIVSPYAFTGVPSGINGIDEITGGWQPGDYIILMAEPSAGKTALSMQCAWNAVIHAEKKVNTAFFSLEMSSTAVMKRLLSNVSGVELNKILRPKTLTDDEKQRVYDAGNKISSQKIFLDNPSSMTVLEFRIKARKLVEEENVGFIVLDYLQLMKSGAKGSNNNKEAEASFKSSEIKATAQELNVPILVISSMNRTGQARDSGGIDYDADVRMVLKKATEEEIKMHNLGSDDRLLDITKHRNGKLDCVRLQFTPEIQHFSGFNDRPFSQQQPDRPFAGINPNYETPNF